MIKLVVISTRNQSLINSSCYKVLFNDTSIDWNVFSFGIRNLINFFQSNKWPYNCKRENYKFESNISHAFCEIANNLIGENIFVVGNLDECVVEYQSLLAKHCHVVFPNNIDRKIFFSSKPDADRYLNNSYALESAYRELEPTKENYALFINWLLEQDLLDVNGLTPIITDIDLPMIYGGHNWAKFAYEVKEDSLILNFASTLLSTDLFVKLLDKGATKFQCIDGNFKGDSNFIRILIELYKGCDTIYKYDLIRKFEKIYPHKLKEYLSANCYHEYNRYRYRALLRLNDKTRLLEFIDYFNPRLFIDLSSLNLYNGEHETSNADFLPVSNDIKNLISERIMPAITRALNSSNTTSNSIWGYNAITGAPITNDKLRDIDSQKWW